MVDEIRNFLTTPETGNMKLDLFSLNVQRGRDHGICSLKQARAQIGLSDASFADLFGNANKASKL